MQEPLGLIYKLPMINFFIKNIFPSAEQLGAKPGDILVSSVSQLTDKLTRRTYEVLEVQTKKSPYPFAWVFGIRWATKKIVTREITPLGPCEQQRRWNAHANVWDDIIKKENRTDKPQV